MILPDITLPSAGDAQHSPAPCGLPSPTLRYDDMHPRAQLWLHQSMTCAIGGSPIRFDAPALRDLDGARISALVCRSCVLRPEALVHPPVLSAPALLRLRLTQGPIFVFNRLGGAEDAAALSAGNWDHFTHPFHALWTQQGGRCAVYDPSTHGSLSEASARFLVADYDPEDGKVDGLICKQCQPLETKVKGQAADVWVRYRKDLPGRECRATRGLTRALLLHWNRDLFNSRRSMRGAGA